MRHPHHSTERQQLRVHMTPMIDVVFLLLIFFVCTASFQADELVLPSNLRLPRGANVSLPVDLDPTELERIVVEVTDLDSRPQFSVNGHLCPTLDRLGETLSALAEIDSTLPVILDISSQVTLGAAIDAYDNCRLAGFANIQFAASIPRP